MTPLEKFGPETTPKFLYDMQKARAEIGADALRLVVEHLEAGNAEHAKELAERGLYQMGNAAKGER